MTRVHAVDGTSELFRNYFGAPEAVNAEGVEVGATRGLLRTLASLVKQPDVTHVAVAFDTVIESFRNDLFDGYKTGDGIEPDLWGQFPLAEQATHALGITVWSMIEFEADDALATAAARWGDDPAVEQVVLCTPDKDLAQCVRGQRVVMLDRRRQKVIDEAAVLAKFGVPPGSIPDYLALVGDDADGIPGIPRWGAKSSAVVLDHYRQLEHIPADAAAWEVAVRGKDTLANNLAERRDDALLYRTLATLRGDVPLDEELEDLRWRGVRAAELAAFCERIGIDDFEVPSAD